MERLKLFYHKSKVILLLMILPVLSVQLYGQMNCKALFEKDSPEYCACMLMYGNHLNEKDNYQGSKRSQALCDSAIKLFPTFADAYYIKAIPFLKRGEFDIWKTIIDKAVEYDSLLYLGYRGGAQFMFLRNYEEAIKDIETLQSISKWDIGTIYNGEYHLEIIRALSYKGLGDTIKAITILENHIRSTNDPGMFGLYHLGVMYFEQERYNDAEKALLKQISDNEIAEAHYYLSLIYKTRHNITHFDAAIRKAYHLYLDGYRIRGNDSFMDYPHKIYLKQIEELIVPLAKNGM